MSRESEKNFLSQFSTDKNQCQKIAKTTKNKNNATKKFQKLIQPAKNKNKSKSKTKKNLAKNKKPQDIVTNAIIYLLLEQHNSITEQYNSITSSRERKTATKNPFFIGTKPKNSAKNKIQ